MDRRIAWREFATRESGEFAEGRRASADRVMLRHRAWRLELGTYVQSTGTTYVTYTRLRASFAGHRRLRLSLRRRNVFDRFFAALGFGSPPPLGREFLERWVVQGKPAARLPSLLAGGALVDSLPHEDLLSVRVGRADRKARKRHGEDTGTVTCLVTGVLTDVDSLSSMLHVVQEMLDALHRIGEASDRELEP